jgi:fructose-1,6-bisphosphatase/inositol monophosphatase family enzyme
MVALVQNGELALAGIYLPLVDRLYTAICGAGAWENERVVAKSRRDRLEIAGTIYTKFLDADARTALESRAQALARTGQLSLHVPVMCAAHQYTELLLGRQDFAVYQRLLPWDHAPGALLLRESGGVSRHTDGRDYRASDRSGPLIAAVGSAAWSATRELLFA